MDFLNSFAFEQMAREYNEKYNINNNVGVLENKEEILLEDSKDIFKKIFNLFNLLKSTFGGFKQFSSFFEKAENIKNEIKNYFETAFNENFSCEDFIKPNRPANHKICANALIDAYIEIFKLNSNALSEIEKIKNNLLTFESMNNENHNQNSTLKLKFDFLVNNLFELQEIFKDFSIALKEFYSVIR